MNLFHSGVSNIVEDKVRCLNMIKINSVNQSFFKRILLGTVSLLIFAVLFTSCASSPKYASDNAADYPNNQSTGYVEAPQAPSDPQSAYEEERGVGEGNYTDAETKESGAFADIMSQRKIIKEGDVSLESLQFDDSVAAMDKLIDDFGGFSELRTVTGKSDYSNRSRTASYVIRVPTESFDLVLKNMGNVGTVLESSSKGTDITDKYFDAQTRIKALKVQEETLLDILAKSAKLEDVIALESRISEVRYEIESLENTVKNYDRLVSFSRITIFIQEVNERSETKPNPATLGERISGSFKESIEDFKRGFENFIVWLAGAWISMLFLIIVIIIVGINVRTYKRRKEKKKIIVDSKTPEKESEE